VDVPISDARKTAMIAENSDWDALVAQGDIERFYRRVIEPALAEFVVGEDVAGLETDDMDEFLEACRRNTNNTLAYEMRRTFALILSALFERQLRFWLLCKRPADHAEIESFGSLFRLIDYAKREYQWIGAKPFIADILILGSVANAVRHGNGHSATALSKRQPKFWNQSPPPSDLVSSMRIGDADLKRFAYALMAFWHAMGASSIPG
jgi:hypothetical protein